RVRPSPAPPDVSALSLHDALPISARTLFEASDRRFGLPGRFAVVRCTSCGLARTEPQPDEPARFYPPESYYSYAPPSPPSRLQRSEEHTSELQSLRHLVCRLLLEK